METKKAQQPLDQSESPTHTRRAAAMVWLGVRWLGWFIRSFLLFAFWSTAANDEKTRRARRARIEERMATVNDYRAEMAAQEREVAAAVKEKSEVDDEIETAKAEIAIMVELKDELAQLATSIRLETDKQKEYLNQTKTFTTHIAAMRADIETLKSQRQALEQQMGK